MAATRGGPCGMRLAERRSRSAVTLTNLHWWGMASRTPRRWSKHTASTRATTPTILAPTTIGSRRAIGVAWHRPMGGGRLRCHGYCPSMSSERFVAAPREVVRLSEKFESFVEYWSPRTVATFNGHDVMVVKVNGEFVWHTHDDTDDFFLVLSGRLTIRLRDGDVVLTPGDLFVVPVGVEHQPFAEEETHLLLIEPSGTPNTGEPETAAQRTVI